MVYFLWHFIFLHSMYKQQPRNMLYLPDNFLFYCVTSMGTSKFVELIFPTEQVLLIDGRWRNLEKGLCELYDINTYHIYSQNTLTYYFKFKCNFEHELNIDVLEDKFRNALSRFRLAYLSLEIETCRYINLDIMERKCKFCSMSTVESEFHFLCIWLVIMLFYKLLLLTQC